MYRKFFGTQEQEIKSREESGFRVVFEQDGLTILAKDWIANTGKLILQGIGFGGRRAKPDFNFTFSSVERRETYIDEYISIQARRAAAKVQRNEGRTISPHAAAAKAIKTELKTAFPCVVFSITSNSFSMGNSVSIEWTDGPTSGQIEEISGKYQYGDFNGMEDLYEYSNVRKDIPQTKYVHTQRNMSDMTRAALKEKAAREWGADMDDDAATREKTGYYPDSLIHQEFHKLDLSVLPIVEEMTV